MGLHFQPPLIDPTNNNIHSDHLSIDHFRDTTSMPSSEIMFSTKDDPGDSDNCLVVSDIEDSQNVILSLRPAVFDNKQPTLKRSHPAATRDDPAKKYRRLESLSGSAICEKQNIFPNSTSRDFSRISPATSKRLVTLPNAPLPPQKKPRAFYTEQQLEWLTDYCFTMPDSTTKSWNIASGDFESTWGQAHTGKVLRAKVIRMGLGILFERSNGGLPAVEMNIDELSDTEAATAPSPKTPVAQETAGAYQVTPPVSPQGARNRELWLKDNIHKFQKSKSEIDWESLVNLFNDIFDMKKSTTALEVMWERAINKNCGLIRSFEGWGCQSR
ncbi:uncharacterized protein LAJ45_08653 [Morchella importuna]|uniref:uncharacterized protein n=1 Tax=Morchella importuna TaxID=1174673 RepID=UPI001E8E3BA3|nr:uncharacterized protein LAJ45_08653 [Morchella importuna]KAH8147175.1 hypothetical protein LAJ45_08653 [Morchella importuna]